MRFHKNFLTALLLPFLMLGLLALSYGIFHAISTPKLSFIWAESKPGINQTSAQNFYLYDISTHTSRPISAEERQKFILLDPKASPQGFSLVFGQDSNTRPFPLNFSVHALNQSKQTPSSVNLEKISLEKNSFQTPIGFSKNLENPENLKLLGWVKP